jgi:prophage regulatory protein
MNNLLPPTGFLRLKQIIGDPKANPPIPGLIPVSASHWYRGVEKGIYPKGIKLSDGVIVYPVEEIQKILDRR